MAKDDNITCEVEEAIAELGERGNWWLELNKVKWNGKEAKFDIRPWDECHEKMGKGVTMNEEEARKLRKALDAYFDEKDGVTTKKEGNEIPDAGEDEEDPI